MPLNLPTTQFNRFVVARKQRQEQVGGASGWLIGCKMFCQHRIYAQLKF